MNSLNERILKLAYRTVDAYKDDISAESLKLINGVIYEFESYYASGSKDYRYLCELVQGENGIWTNAANSKLPEKEQEMWDLEVDCLLACLLKLEMIAHGDSGAEDFEVEERNIPPFVSYMEKNFKSSADYKKTIKFWNKAMGDYD
ncbi:MAG: hypothetical protein K2N33_03835 [Clostridia bacterium]|nr:hypothetical protein [Clostridia bacterium]